MDLDIRRLRVLREVALRGTIVAAADSLGFTPSAISQQLTALERESGSVLLERTGRGVRLTDAGHVLVARTKPVLVALEEAKAALEESRTIVAGDSPFTDSPNSAFSASSKSLVDTPFRYSQGMTASSRRVFFRYGGNSSERNRRPSPARSRVFGIRTGTVPMPVRISRSGR